VLVNKFNQPLPGWGLGIDIGHEKNLDTIGKQNYQDQGVEAELNFEFYHSKQ